MISASALTRSRQTFESAFAGQPNEIHVAEGDEEEDLQHALLLSRVQADMSWRRSQGRHRDVLEEDVELLQDVQEEDGGCLEAAGTETGTILSEERPKSSGTSVVVTP